MVKLEFELSQVSIGRNGVLQVVFGHCFCGGMKLDANSMVIFWGYVPFKTHCLGWYLEDHPS